MKKQTLLYAALSFVLTIAFTQCSPPKPTEAEVTTQEELDISMNTMEATPIEETTAIVEPVTIEEPASISNPIATKKSIPVEKPKPIETPKPVNTPIPIEKPKSVDKPIAVVEPVSFKSSGFTLKLLKATVQGTSTLHEWESKVTKIDAKGAFQIKDNSITAIQNAEIKIAVRGIISKEGKKMDDKTYEAFNSDENPNITYSFSNAVIKINAKHEVTIETSGKLSMGGATLPVSLSATGNELPNGDLKLTVSKKLKMTDFNMVPPVMFLGTIKVGDEITVNFDFELSKSN